MFNSFPDHRERRSIAAFFFCHTLLYRPLFQLPRLADIGDTLFRSPYILRLLGFALEGSSPKGFNARQMDVGFCAEEGQKPFDVESIGELFTQATAEDFPTFQLRWLEAIYRAWPLVFAKGLWVMDSVHFSTPKGARGLPEGEYKASP